MAGIVGWILAHRKALIILYLVRQYSVAASPLLSQPQTVHAGQCFAKCPFTCQFDQLSDQLRQSLDRLSDQLCQSLDRLSDHFAKALTLVLPGEHLPWFLWV